MEIKTKKEMILEGIRIVENISTTKMSLPILSYTLLKTQDNSLRLTTTDLDIGISCEIPVEIKEKGSVCVPTKKFAEIIRNLNEEDVEIITKKNNYVFIQTKNCKFKILGLGSEEFPRLPELKEKQNIKLEQEILKDIFRLTSFAVSFDETRYVLNGVFFKIEKNKMEVVATDGKCLSLIEQDLKENLVEPLRFIVPIKTVQELNRNLTSEGEVSLTFSTNQILFELNGIVIISRLIEGEFPDYRQVIPPPSENKFTIERLSFLGALQRANLLATPDYQAVKLEVFKNKLVVSKSTPDLGEFYEELPIKNQGKEMIIGFNPQYLINVLKNLEEEEVSFELFEPEKPAVLRRQNFIYVVSPMHLG